MLHTKFVLKRKRDEHGAVSLHKARLVIFCNEQTDFNEDSFSPVTVYTVAKAMICLALQKGGHARHFDFESTFHNGRLERPVYAEIPRCYYDEGMTKDKSEHSKYIPKLKRSLYGL